MSYRNKYYACFDGDSDIRYFNLLKAWAANETHEFDYFDAHALSQARDSSSEETIKRSLKERLKSSKVLLVLVGNKTKNLFKFVRWEIETAIELNIPIIVVNLNGLKEMDINLCPPILRDQLAIHIPWGQKIISYALANWPELHKTYHTANKIGGYKYNASVYSGLGL